jgi:hypothetical protein
MNYRKALLDKIESFDFGRNGQAMPVVSLEDFFTGNDEEGSIGCNLLDHPGLPFFFETLKSIRNKDNVQDVVIVITDIDTLKEPYNEWAFSDRIYVITKANLEEVKEWLVQLSPDEVEVGWAANQPHPTAPIVLESNKVYSAWWD